MLVLFPLLLFTYPLVLHLGVYFGHVELALVYLGIMLTLPFLFALLRQTKPVAWQIITAGLAFILLLLEKENYQLIIKLIPLSVNSLLLWLFASTLGKDRIPLITRFASLMRKDMPPAVIIYTRWATVAWSVYFLLMTILLLLFSVYASLEVWSFFSNILSYFLLAMMFLAEFIVRRIFLRKYMDYSFTEFIQRLRHIDFRSVYKSTSIKP